MSEKPPVSELLKRTLLRSVLIVLTIVGALYIFGVIFNLREGTAATWQVVLGVMVFGSLVVFNGWWYRRSNTRL